MAKPYYAHKKDGRVQTIAEHAAGTAEFASSFAGVFGYAALGTLLGKYHDTGKYGDGFQAGWMVPGRAMSIPPLG